MVRSLVCEDGHVYLEKACEVCKGTGFTLRPDPHDRTVRTKYICGFCVEGYVPNDNWAVIETLLDERSDIYKTIQDGK